MTFIGLAVLASLALLVGRLAARVARVGWLDRFHPDVLPLQAALGTALLTSLTATASHAGIGQRHALAVVGVAVVVLVIGAARTRGQRSRPRRRRPRWTAWLPLAVALVAAAGIGLLPIVRYGSFSPFSDAFYYDALSDWLVEHGIDEIAPEATAYPALSVAANTQKLGLRVGTSYLQAGLTAALGASHALLLFYAVSCWGFVLLAGCLYSLSRLAFRLTPWIAAAVVCTTVCVPAGTTHALQAGFQAQLYGLASLATLLAVSARLLRPAHRTTGAFVLLGALLAWQASAYSELLPVSVAALGVWLWAAARRRRAPARLSLPRAAVAFLLAFVLFGQLEIVRAFDGLPVQLRAEVGAHIERTTADWLGLFSGAAIYPIMDEHAGLNFLALVGPVVPLVLFLIGILRARTRSLGTATVGACAVLAALAAYFTLLATDPWTKDRPHTWSLHKLSEWAHPFVIVGAWAGLAGSLRSRRSRAIAAVAAVAAVVAGLPLHTTYARVLSFSSMREFTGSERPLDELEPLCRNMALVSRRPMYVVTRPELTDPGYVELLGYLTIHGRAYGRWEGCKYIYMPWVPWLAPEHTDRVPPEEDVALLCHDPHFAIPGSVALGGNVVAAPLTAAPLLCQVANPNGVQVSPKGEPVLWIGGAPTTLVVFAPRAGRLRVDFFTHFGRADRVTARHLEVSNRGRIETATIERPVPRTRVPAGFFCDVEAGVNAIRLRCTDPPGAADVRADGGLLQLTFSSPRLSFDGP